MTALIQSHWNTIYDAAGRPSEHATDAEDDLIRRTGRRRIAVLADAAVSLDT
jgi:hypothetical protein